MNSRPINHDPWIYVIYVGQRYLVNNVVSTNFQIVIAYLSSYYVIYNHPVMGLLISMALSY